MARGRNDYETAQIQGRLWTPAVLRPKSWHDASDQGTITITGSGISEWRDKSGNGISLSQATDAERPELIPTKLSTFSAVKFYNAGTTFGDKLVGSAPFTSGAEMTVIWLALQPPAASDNYPWNWTFANDANRISVTGPYQNSLIHYADLNGFGGTDRMSGSGPSHNTWNIYRLRNSVTGSVKSIFANGESSSFASQPAGSSGTLTTFKLGNGPDNTYCGIAMSEILTFNSDLPTQDAKAVEGYLAWKWGLPLAADHPFVNRPPLIGD